MPRFRRKRPGQHRRLLPDFFEHARHPAIISGENSDFACLSDEPRDKIEVTDHRRHCATA
jgi:hypothetical protein